MGAAAPKECHCAGFRAPPTGLGTGESTVQHKLLSDDSSVVTFQTDDKFWVVVFACAPCIALLAAGDERPSRFTCPAGVSKLSCSLRIGHGMHAMLVRDGVVVAQCHPQEFRFQAEPKVYNFNAYVAASE